MRFSRSTWLSAALSLLVAGAALAQKIPPAELAALSHVQSAFFTGADSGVMALQVTVAPELQRSVISSGTVSLAGENVRETRQDVQRVVDAQGGEITDETTETEEAR